MHYKEKPLYESVKQAIAEGKIIPIKQEYTGVGTGLNGLLHYNSAQRAAMFGGHLSQALVIKDAKPSRLTTGIEYQYGQNTWSVEFPVESRIIDIIPRFQPGHTANSIKTNTMHYVLYENQEDGNRHELRLLEVPEHHIMHQQYGFRFRPTNLFHSLRRGQIVPRYSRLMESPAINQETREWGYGRDCKVCFGSFYQCIEDGGVARRGVLKHFTSTGIEKRTITSGKSRYPINLYGDDEVYQAIPENGERIRKDGLLAATREIDPILSVVDMMTCNLQRVDYVYDDLTYAEPNARVTDIDVVSDRHRRSGRQARERAIMMEEKMRPPYRQFLKYENAIGLLYTRIQDAVRKYERERAGTPIRHHQTVMWWLNLADAEHGIDIRNPNGQLRHVLPTRDYRKENLDDWRVTITYTYDVVPGIGFKFTGMAGDKFVVTDIMEDDEMPVDQWGNVADFMFDDSTVIKRMSLSRVNAPYINGVGDQIMRELKPVMDAGDLETAWNTLMRYYYIVSPEFVEQVVEKHCITDEDKWDHLRYVQRHGTEVYIPTDSIAAGSERMENLIREFPLKKGPVRYRGRSGRWRTTKNDIAIGDTYIMMLEKTANDWSAVGIPKLQAHGLPSKLSNSDKYSSPGKEQPTRYCGESEHREVTAFAGGWFASVFMDYANNPKQVDSITESIYATDKPSAITIATNFEKYPIGGNRALRILYHQLNVAGGQIIDADDCES